MAQLPGRDFFEENESIFKEHWFSTRSPWLEHAPQIIARRFMHKQFLGLARLDRNLLKIGTLQCSSCLGMGETAIEP